MDQHYIIRIESFEGRDTHLFCGDAGQDYLFAVVGIGDDHSAEIVDGGYRSFEEAALAWPHALNAQHAFCPRIGFDWPVASLTRVPLSRALVSDDCVGGAMRGVDPRRVLQR